MEKPKRRLRWISVMLKNPALTDGFNYSKATLQFHYLSSMAGQIFLRKSVSLLVVHLLSCMHKRPLNYWHLFHVVSPFFHRSCCSPLPAPTILSLNKHPFLLLLFKAKKISALHFCLTSHTSLLNFPQTQAKNRLGLFH